MRNIAITVLVLFSGFSLWVLSGTGYLGLWQYLFASPAGWQVLVDLCIALAFVLSWMRLDAARKGRAFWPYVVLTLAAGSIGPLLYLALGDKAQQPAVSNA